MKRGEETIEDGCVRELPKGSTRQVISEDFGNMDWSNNGNLNFRRKKSEKKIVLTIYKTNLCESLKKFSFFPVQT